MSKVVLHLNWCDSMAFVRRHWRLLAVIGAIVAIIILATHIDLRQILTNPVALLVGGILIVTHMLGGVVITFVVATLRRRR